MGSFGKVKWLRMGFLGFPGSGKTYTAAQVGAHLLKSLGTGRPLRVFDTEGGVEYQLDEITRITGCIPEGDSAQSFVDLMNFTNTVMEGDVVLIDSVTHPWNELLSAKQEALGDFQGIMGAKKEWATKFSAWFLSVPAHVIICGRAGYEFDHEIDPKTGKKNLVKTGTKMKTEGDFGFEPSLLVEMERVEKPDGTLVHDAIIKKDRFSVMDGRRYENPSFETFKPFFDRMDLSAGAGLPSLDTSEKTYAELDDNGRSKFFAMLQEREIILEEIKADMTEVWPGTAGAMQQMKIKALKFAFDTGSWTKLEKDHKAFPPEGLRAGRDKLRGFIQENATKSVAEKE